MLRSYAAVGMLVPAAVDRFTGYRYYSPDQLGEAGLILLLRQAGVPVSEIACFLKDRDLGRLRRWELELDLEIAGRRIAFAEVRERLSADDCWLKASFGRSVGAGQPPSVEALVEAARDASLAVWQRMEADKSLEGIGTTLTAVAVLDAGPQPRLAVVNVGDSRAYLFTGGQLQQVTHDDSVVQGLIDAGEVQPQEWRDHPSRSLLTRALGTAAVVEPDIRLPRVPAAARVLICTDGLTSTLDEASVSAVLGAEPNPDRAAAELIRLVESSAGPDDATVVVVDLPAPA